MNRVSIETTQNVQIDYELASIGDRILAFLIDLAIIVAYLIASLFGLFYLGESLVNSHLFVPFRVILFLPVLFYTLASEIFFNGQTVGKKQRKIKVICVDGSQPTITHYLIRWVLRIVDIYLLQGAVAIIALSVNGKGQRLADMAAGTTVVKVKPKVELADLKRFFKTIEDEHYQPTYDQVLILSDNDINIIKDLIAKRNKIRDPKVFYSLSKKIQETLNINYEGEPMPFLRKILEDYNYLANQEEF